MGRIFSNRTWDLGSVNVVVMFSNSSGAYTANFSQSFTFQPYFDLWLTVVSHPFSPSDSDLDISNEYILFSISMSISPWLVNMSSSDNRIKIATAV